MVQQYLDHSKLILTSPESVFKTGSKKMGLISYYGHQSRYNLSEGFPLLTTKKMGIRMAAHELIWFMKGETNIKYLVDNNVPFWNWDTFDHNKFRLKEAGYIPEAYEKNTPEWHAAVEDYIERIKEDGDFAREFGDAGPIYGKQWRDLESIDGHGNSVRVDQLNEMVDMLIRKPTSKRNIVSSWNPAQISDMALPPCHTIFQTTSDGEKLYLQMFQRSCDQFLGVPFNIIGYSLLSKILTQKAGLKEGIFVHTFGDSHFYTSDGKRLEWYRENHGELRKRAQAIDNSNDPERWLELRDWINDNAPLELDQNGSERVGRNSYDHVTAIAEQLSRSGDVRPSPRIKIADKSFDEFTIEDFVLDEKSYNPHGWIFRAMPV